jgi:ATP-binding cassette subfamily C (CFTR/MRP) protein 10
MRQKIIKSRNEELKYLKKMKYFDSLGVYFWATTPLLVSFASFAVHYFRGEKLSPSNVFASIALFNMLLVPINAYPWVINGFCKFDSLSKKRLILFFLYKS